MNWHFALGIAAGAGALVGLAIWMIHGAVFPAQPKQATRSDEQQ